MLSVGKPRGLLEAFPGFAQWRQIEGIYRAPSMGEEQWWLVDVGNLKRQPGTSYLRLFDQREHVKMMNLRDFLSDETIPEELRSESVNEMLESVIHLTEEEERELKLGDEWLALRRQARRADEADAQAQQAKEQAQLAEEQTRQLLLLLLESRFGAQPRDWAAVLAALSGEQLARFSNTAQTASSIEELEGWQS